MEQFLSYGFIDTPILNMSFQEELMSIQVRTLMIAAALLAMVFPVAAQQATIPEDLTTQINELVRPAAETELFSGILLVARGPDILYHEAFGNANWEHRVPNTHATRFGIGSVTKTMTITVIQSLVREGQLDLDSPVEQYIEGFPMGPNGGIPTINHLLRHRSGVPHRVTDQVDETQMLRPSDIVRRVQETGLMFEPGTRRLYSSAGYTCLARVIEVIEKKPFDVVLAERIFSPAEMAAALSETGQRLMLQRAMPYRLGVNDRKVVVKNAPYKDLRFLTGAGSIFATAEDLLHFVQAIHDGTFGRALWDQMFGTNETTWSGLYGRINGYEASVDVLPAQNLIFILLSNLQSVTTGQVRTQIQNVLLGEDSKTLPLPPSLAERFEERESLVGSYGRAKIILVEGKLYRGENEVHPIDGGRYYIPASGTIMQFRRDSTGEVDALISISAGGQETVLLKSSGN